MSDRTTSSPVDDGARYVYVQRPRCPKCGGGELLAYRTNPDAGDGSVSRYVRCRDCGHRCIVVEE